MAKESQSPLQKLFDQSGQIIDVVKDSVGWASGKTQLIQKKSSLMLQLIKLKRQETRLFVKLGQRIFSVVSEEGADEAIVNSLEKFPVVNKLISDLNQVKKEVQDLKEAQDKL